jgi:hypothetical protein
MQSLGIRAYLTAFSMFVSTLIGRSRTSRDRQKTRRAL